MHLTSAPLPLAGIGVGIVGFGLFFILFGVLLYFDSVLMAFGNVSSLNPHFLAAPRGPGWKITAQGPSIPVAAYIEGAVPTHRVRWG